MSILNFWVKDLDTLLRWKFGTSVALALSSHHNYKCQSNIVIHSCIIIPQDLGGKAEYGRCLSIDSECRLNEIICSDVNKNKIIKAATTMTIKKVYTTL